MQTGDFQFNGATLTACADAALWWAAERVLCVSDLHLGKSERIARRGGTLLPPYDTAETLSRLRDAVQRFDPAVVICLGDSFDDLAAGEALDAEARQALTVMMAGRQWIWIEGNHDPGPVDLGGVHRDEVRHGPLTFRHIAEHDAEPGEISGHWHPKARLSTPRGRVGSSCFVVTPSRVILPAFGAYTGGLSVTHDALAPWIEGETRIILTRAPQHHIPFDRISP
ncbi:hypothetical protein FHS89_001966 [Rubricella aquisinus]|uniref:Calcineurin-like phosphoesterase domain-containing protein n=1 Tax=Rubricella aquisinus TaxID=2028108 RepID=A0A840X258_9RHOB|nr:ligase-associated DNA damage response endonuclease PdeM [Rubricella aquisinus]MBB5515946.1 hypothetical protein [Rubricella aquisinus]